jgi:hypothetical protein
VNEAHIVFVEIGKLFHFSLLEQLLLLLRVALGGGDGLKLEIIINVIFYDFIDNFLFLIMVCKLDKFLTISGSEDVSFEP